MRTVLSLLSMGFLLASTATPTTAILPEEEDACEVETLDLETQTLACILATGEEVVKAVGNVSSAAASSTCHTPGRTRYEYGDSETLWTPLYASNSPLQGWASVDVQHGQSAGLAIGFSWGGSGVKLKKTETTDAEEGFTAEAGESVVVYQQIAWAEYEKYECIWMGWWAWEKVEEGCCRPSDYTPGSPEGDRRQGNLEAGAPEADWDNNIRPWQDWADENNTMALDLRYKGTDVFSDCLKDRYLKFGKERVYSTEVQMNFKGTLMGGWSGTDTKRNTFRYDFTDGCYYMDPLGPEASSTGLAFYMYGEDADYPPDDDSCSPKGILEEALDSCASQTCTEDVSIAPEACEALPGCTELDEATDGALVEVVCGVPEECGDGGTEEGEACVPSKPSPPSCPPPSIAVSGVDRCNPCDFIGTKALECGSPLPACEDAGLDCPPVGKPPCGEYAPGIEGAIAKWVCEGGEDPCLGVLEAVDELLACGGPPED